MRRNSYFASRLAYSFFLLTVILFSSLATASPAKADELVFSKTYTISRRGAFFAWGAFASSETGEGILRITKNTPDKRIRSGHMLLPCEQRGKGNKGHGKRPKKCWPRPVNLTRFLHSSETVFEIDVTIQEFNAFLLFLNGKRGASITVEFLIKGEEPPPLPTAELFIAPVSITQGQAATLTWHTENAESVTLSPIDGASQDVDASGSLSVFPETDTTYTLTAQNETGTVTAQASIEVAPPVYEPEAFLSVDPAVITIGQSTTLTWTSQHGDTVTISPDIGAVGESGSMSVSPENKTTYTLTVENSMGVAAATATVDVRPDVEPQPQGSFGAQYEDLIPTNTGLEEYSAKRFALITGRVEDVSGASLPGVTVSIHDHPEYGSVRTDLQGEYVIPVEGGGAMTVVLSLEGYITAHRKVMAPWNDYAVADLAVLITQDDKATEVVLDGDSTNVTLHESSVMTDVAGSRSVTMVFTGDNRAYETDAEGNDLRELTTFTTRATEFPTYESMPAKLPPLSGFTWCADMRVDGADHVRFEKPVVTYLDNFLGFPVGTAVPAGYYDEHLAAWIASEDGVVVMLLDENGDGEVDGLDADGDMAPDDLDGDGDTWNEITGLDQDLERYKPGEVFWRVEVTHFTSWDYNFLWGVADGDSGPNAEEETSSDQESCWLCKVVHNSYVSQRSRVFHEDVPIPGTGMTLHYSSNRVPGYKHVITVPLSGDEVPSRMLQMVARVTVAGRVLIREVDPEPNKTVEIEWDGLDKLGRPALASQATVDIGFRYPMVLYGYARTPGEANRSFGQAGGGNTMYIVPNPRYEFTIQKTVKLDLKQPKARQAADELAEGWTLSGHHRLYLFHNVVLFKGNGDLSEQESPVVKRLPPEVTAYFTGAVGPDGDYYYSHYQGGITTVRKITSEGVMTVVAGGGDTFATVEGVPVDQVRLMTLLNLDVADDGTIFMMEVIGQGHSRVLRIKNGKVQIWAGTLEEGGYTGDGGLALDALFNSITWIATDSQGNLYVSDMYADAVRKIDPTGIITTFIGGGGSAPETGLKATEVSLRPMDIAFDAADNMYVADGYSGRFMRVEPSGDVTVLGGTGSGSNNQNLSYPGDGSSHRLVRNWYQGGWHFDVDEKGDMYTVLGYTLPYAIVRIDTTNCQMAIEGQTDMGFGGIPTIARTPDGSFFVSTHNGIDYWSPAVHDGEARFEDNGVTHVFDSRGRHLRSEDTDTGVVLATYEYTPDEPDQSGVYQGPDFGTGGRLQSVTDRFGNEVTIEMDGDGYVSAIVAPDGQRTSVQVDADGRITSVSYEDGGSYGFEYDADGLMLAETDPAGWRFTHAFDDQGRIEEQTDPEGGRWTNSRDTNNESTIHQEISAEGVVTSYKDRHRSDGYSSTITDGNGGVTEFYRSPSASHIEKTLPSGLRLTFDYLMDSVRQVKRLKKSTATTPGGLTMVTEQGWSYTDSDQDGLYELITRTATVNGKTATSTHDVWASELTATSPTGRTVTSQYDPLTLLTQSVQTPGLADTSYEYDARGRVTRVTTGDRYVDYTYDSDGWLESVTDAKGLTTSYDYDEVGRVTTVHRPDGTTTRFTYDANGNMRVLTTPSDAEHEYEYNGVGAPKTYYPPLTNSIVYEYDRDRRLTRIDMPSGKSIVTHYDMDRLYYIETPEGNIDYSYYPDTTLLQSISMGSESISYTYDAALVKSINLSGTIDATLSYNYDNDFRVTSFGYAGETESFIYDLDGLLTDVGDYTITRDPDNGLALELSGNGYAMSRSVNQYGETDSWDVTINGGAIAEYTLHRDEVGRITGKDETIDGITHNYVYEYDDLGRLTTVTRDSIVVESYEYNGPHNARSSESNTLRGISNRSYNYDLEDHLLSAGGTSFTYDDDGYLRTKTVGGETTTYTYSSRGELLQVDLPSGQVITYTYDPMGRRIQKAVDGTAVEYYLWAGMTTLLAVYDGSGVLKQRFEYAAGRLPVRMVEGGTAYHLVYDQVGTLRAVVDGSGNVVKEIQYDIFGNIIEDSDPSLSIPFGFAGGLYDEDTRLVKLGARDYDSDVGRWTSKDPIAFDGGDTDLYGYCMGDPVGAFDPDGLLKVVLYDPDFALQAQSLELHWKRENKRAKRNDKIHMQVIGSAKEFIAELIHLSYKCKNDPIDELVLMFHNPGGDLYGMGLVFGDKYPYSYVASIPFDDRTFEISDLPDLNFALGAIIKVLTCHGAYANAYNAGEAFRDRYGVETWAFTEAVNYAVENIEIYDFENFWIPSRGAYDGRPLTPQIFLP